MKTVYGEAGVIDPNTTAVELPAPENGDDVDGPPMEGTLQVVANWLSQLGYEITYRDYVGSAKLRWALNAAAVKAITGMADGHVVVVPSQYTAPAIRQAAVFVYDPISVAPETQIPGLPGAFLVISPNSGVGRWVNVAAGLGWSLGAEPRFLPRGQKRSGIERAYRSGAGWDAVVDPAGDFPIGIQVDLPPGICRHDTTFQIVAGFSARLWSHNFYDFWLECSIGGGAWSEVEGSRRRAGGDTGAIGVWFPITLTGYGYPASTQARRYRVAADFSDADEIHLHQTWTIQVQWHWDGVL